MIPLFAGGGPVPPVVILLFALALDALIGDPRWLWRALPHPVAIVGWSADKLEVRLNRPNRTRNDRIVRGALVALALVALAVALGVGVTELRRRAAWGWGVELALVWSLMAQRSLFDHVLFVARAMKRNGLAGGRAAVSRIVGRDPDSLDEYGVARAAIESCAENFADGVVAPVFWYVLFGCPGLFAFKTVNTLDSMIGHRNPRFEAFGKLAARLDDVMNLLPARIAGLLLVASSLFVPAGKPFAAAKIMLTDHAHHDSPNSGWPEAAMAGALDLALAGPRHYPGEVVQGRWIGSGRARATLADITRALYMLVIACLIEFGLVVGLFIIENRL
jgi:adenosylcobinamide-phosphate synthase